MLLQLDDGQPPLPPPASVPLNTDMERHSEETMREFNVHNDVVVALCHQKCDQDRTIHYTEAELKQTHNIVCIPKLSKETYLGNG